MRNTSICLYLAAIAASGCSTTPAEDKCNDGVCFDLDATAKGPGPCESALSSGSYANHCTYTFDGDKPIKYACYWTDDVSHGAETTTWKYDATGELTGVDHVYDDWSDANGSEYAQWRFTPTEVLYIPGTASGFGTHVGRRYNRNMFQFLPAPGSFALSPSAELGLVQAGDTAFAWTRLGTTWTRTSSTGRNDKFIVDQRGRLIEMHVDSIDTYYTYVGDQLIERRTVADGMRVDQFQYDAGGNLAIWRGDRGGFEAYDNSCW